MKEKSNALSITINNKGRLVFKFVEVVEEEDGDGQSAISTGPHGDIYFHKRWYDIV